MSKEITPIVITSHNPRHISAISSHKRRTPNANTLHITYGSMHTIPPTYIHTVVWKSLNTPLKIACSVACPCELFIPWLSKYVLQCWIEERTQYIMIEKQKISNTPSFCINLYKTHQKSSNEVIFTLSFLPCIKRI